MDVGSNEKKIKSEHVRGSVKVAPVTKKITEKRITWYGHDEKKGRWAHTKKNVICISTRKDTERKLRQNTRRKRFYRIFV